jgi:hypothetical protein
MRGAHGSGSFRLFLCSTFVLLAGSVAFAAGPTVINSSHNDISKPLSQIATRSSANGGNDSDKSDARPTGAAITSSKNDLVAAPLAGPLTGVTVLRNFEGQSAQDNVNVFGFAFVPPDTNGAVGATQFVQMVNVTIAVYDKNTGALELGPAAIHSIWNGFGGMCELGGGTADTADGGDPVVLYDKISGRWLVSQFQFNPTFTHNVECVAISTSSDATGAYNRYEFDFGGNFPDYPKFGVWPDAYYATFNVFPPRGFAGAQACAFDRKAMLVGKPAAAVCFQPGPAFASLLPADLDGNTAPPLGSPNYLVSLADSTHLNLFRFHADFKNPLNSTFAGPTLISVAAFNEICARAVSLSCIQEPSPGESVDGLSDRVMFRLAYRNFGDHESLVVNHTVKGGALGAVRWYEIRNLVTAPAIYQQGTVVDPDVNYWLGSIAQDKAGNTALGFSASGQHTFPSVYVAGRSAADPPGAMFGPLVLANGTGVQLQSFKRWGDYSSMTVDPTDDCTFWYTQEYYTVTGSFNWATRIGAFKFNNCTAKK